jgi:hypothetical protein
MGDMNDTRSQDCQQNTSLNCSLQDEHENSMPLVVFLFLTGTLIVLFNSGVLVLIIKEKKIRHNVYHFLILMLSMSDFVVGLGAVLNILRRIIPILQMSQSFAIFNTLLMTTGLHLSLFQVFLISLQRCLVICRDKWSSYIFSGNRKYGVCIGGWSFIAISNSVLISPPTNPYNPHDSENRLLHVYGDHYMVYRIYMIFLILFLLSSIIILYMVTIVHMHQAYRKIHPIGHTFSSRVHVTKATNNQTTESRAPENIPHTSSSSAQNQVDAGPERLQVGQSNKIVTLRHKKLVSTLQLVGLLITALVIFSGPLAVTLSWFDTVPPKIRGVVYGLFCINSMLNPFLYMWKLVDVRMMVKSALYCCNR